MSKDDIKSQLKLWKQVLKYNEKSHKSIIKKIEQLEKALKK